jgi:hypothetical protein
MWCGFVLLGQGLHLREDSLLKLPLFCPKNSAVRIFYFAFLLLAAWAKPAAAQPGCTDPQATNFDPLAAANDGSCLYPATFYAPTLAAGLPQELREISGFTQAGGRWWGHNDSGFEAEFFRINPETGGFLQKIRLDNAHNRDWEDIASAGQVLYVGDFGNNANDRQNLGIYFVPLAEIGDSDSETVPEFGWSFLPFSYADQVDFSAQPADSSVYDCEAMVVRSGKIHLFTKSRRYYHTAHYVVDADNNVAEKIETFDSDGLITGAALSPDGAVLALVGYDLRPLVPTVFCWLLWDWPAGSDDFFAGNKRRIELGSALQIGQVESIAFATDRAGYLSNERAVFNGLTLVGESIWAFDFGTWVPESVGAGEPSREAARVSASPNPFSQNIHFQFVENQKPDFLRAKNAIGQVVLDLKTMPETLDASHWPKGLYTFEMGWGSGKNTVLKLLKN